MSLRKQVVLVGAVIVVGYGLGILLLSWFLLMGSLQRIEKQHAEQDLIRVRNAVEEELAGLDATTRDYASWDSTYSFMHNPALPYVKTELTDESLKNLRIDAVLLLDTAKTIKTIKVPPRSDGRSISAEDLLRIVQPVAALLTGDNSALALSGINRANSGAFLYAIRPVLTSSHGGPSRGWLIMTRALDQETVQRLSRTVNMKLNFATEDEVGSLVDPSGDPSTLQDRVWVREERAGFLTGYVALRGADGSVAAVLKTETAEVIRAEGRRAQSLLLSSLFGVALLAGATALIWLERVVLHPLGALSETIKQVTDKDDLSQRAPIFARGRNELAFLMTRVNLMLDRLQRSREELVQARTALEHQATHDGLTGALNQMAIRRVAEKEAARALRERKSLAVLMLDLDHFKSVNDTYGHEVGDEVLKAVVRVVQSLLRTYDSVGRYGGEEFLLVAPDCDIDAAQAIAERVMTHVAQSTVTVGKESIRVTVSIGVAASVKADSEQLCRTADEALYEAKRRGRNQVVVAIPSPQKLDATACQPTVN